MNKINVNPEIAGTGIGVIVAFAWNGLVPEYQMPAPVALASAPLLGRMIRWAVAWLPEPTDA